MAEERWRDIPGFDGIYQASDLGRVRVVPHEVRGANWKCPGGFTYTSKGKVLKAAKKNNGYLQVALFKNGRPKFVLVHRAVMAAFCGPSRLQVNHKNEIKTDNRLQNLEYLTAIENVRYSLARPVESYDLKTGETIKRYAAGVDVRIDGFDSGAVNNVALEKRGYLSHKGLGWRYADV